MLASLKYFAAAAAAANEPAMGIGEPSFSNNARASYRQQNCKP
jgi:hypothetical protein